MASDFFKHSSLYFLAEAFNKGLVFFTLPIFTYLLTPSEFGIISIYTTIMGSLIVLMSLSSHQSIIRNFHNSGVAFNKFLGALLPFILLFSASLVGLVYFFALDLAILLSVESSVLVFATLVAFFGVFLQLELSYLLASKSSKAYTKILVLRNILILSFSIVFIVLLEDQPYFGRFYAELLVGVMLFLFSIASLVKVSKLNFDFVRVKQSLSYSLPLVISSLAGLFLLSSDVLFINHFVGSEKTGLYSLALSVSMIVYVLISAINNAWLPFYYQSVNEAKLDEVRKTSKLNVKLVLSFAFLVAVFSEYAVMVMAPSVYYQAHFLIPVIILGFIFLFLSNMFVAYLMYSNKTLNLAIIMTISAAVNMWLNYVLIPKYGYFVAAWTTLFSYFTLFVLNFLNVFYYKATGYFPFSSSVKLFIIFLLLLAIGIFINVPYILGDITFKLCLFLVLAYFYEFKIIEFRRLKDRI